MPAITSREPTKNSAQGKTDQAAQSQAKAQDSLEKALSALNDAAAAKDAAAKADGPPTMAKAGDSKSADGRPADGKANDQASMKPGQQPNGKSKGDTAREKNDAKGNGDREAAGKVSPAAESLLKEVAGDSGFLSLPPREA